MPLKRRSTVLHYFRVVDRLPAALRKMFFFLMISDNGEQKTSRGDVGPLIRVGLMTIVGFSKSSWRIFFFLGMDSK